MEKNYAYECGAFMALAQMMRDQIRDLDSDCTYTREWSARNLRALADQADTALVKFGYTTQGADQ